MKVLLLAGLLLVPSTAQAQGLGEKAFIASEWAVLVGHSLDAAATQRCLGAGRCRELNPWLARYDSPVRFTAAKSIIAVGQLWAMRKLKASGHPRWATVANAAIASGFTVLAIRNERVGQ